jgi:hypothetical protein
MHVSWIRSSYVELLKLSSNENECTPLLAGAPGPNGQSYNFTLSARKGGRSATVYTSVAVVAAAAGATGPPPSATIPPLPGKAWRKLLATSSDALGTLGF